ncbi:hypothetical protein AB3X91_11880 [Paraburkholderia sp. BR14263]|uniref:hypothetical protein n=1 Tax=unclassified Paraburkholderia TaxID=2615204 RepID=UPI0034CE7B93
MTFDHETQPEQPTNPAMLTVLYLIRALHDNGILPAQATADVLDQRALRGAMRGDDGPYQQAVRDTTAWMQVWADRAQTEHPFVPKERPVEPPAEE